MGTEDFLDWFEGAVEKVLAQFFKTGASERSAEVNTLIERVDLD